jgi:hypothetical protein
MGGGEEHAADAGVLVEQPAGLEQVLNQPLVDCVGARLVQAQHRDRAGLFDAQRLHRPATLAPEA